MPDQERYLIAYHEAGHAIAGRAMGLTIHEVSIVPDEDTQGRCKLAGDFFDFGATARLSREDKRQFRALIIYALAGGIAENLASIHQCTDISAFDYQQAYECAMRLSKNPDVYLAARKKETRNLLEMRWGEVQKVATALLKYDRISGDEIPAILAPGEPVYREIHIQYVKPERHEEPGKIHIRRVKPERHEEPKKPGETVYEAMRRRSSSDESEGA